jgi:hypothetical protein
MTLTLIYTQKLKKKKNWKHNKTSEVFDVTVSVLTSSPLDDEFEPLMSQTNDYASPLRTQN